MDGEEGVMVMISWGSLASTSLGSLGFVGVGGWDWDWDFGVGALTSSGFRIVPPEDLLDEGLSTIRTGNDDDCSCSEGVEGIDEDDVKFVVLFEFGLGIGIGFGGLVMQGKQAERLTNDENRLDPLWGVDGDGDWADRAFLDFLLA